jgi:5-methylcytosine-specific restriction endonuclease McrA
MPIKTCEVCGKLFNDNWHKEAKFCSRDCWYKHDHQIRTRKPIDLECKNCGKHFQKLSGYINIKAKFNFCSKKCINQWRANGGMPSGKNHVEYNSVVVTCAFCGKKLIRQPNRILKYPLQFCNRKCHGAWKSENIRGEKHSKWRGGSLPDYGPEWGKIAEEIRKRDSYRCQYCGITQEKYGKKLSVHHIIPFREFGYKRGENENHLKAHTPENLITLCAVCHKKIETGHIQLRISPMAIITDQKMKMGGEIWESL